MNESVPPEHHRCTKSERPYMRGLIHNLSLNRWTDQQIVDYLYEEKKIKIARCSVSRIKNQIEKHAERWYIELRNSRYKYIAAYKERIDSLLSYQKKLHEIIYSSKKAEVQLRAISELHSIEMDIFSLWKQLPDLKIEESTNKGPTNSDGDNEEERRVPCIVDMEDVKGLEHEPWDMETWLQCPVCKRWWSRQDLLDYHRKKTPCAIPPVE